MSPKPSPLHGSILRHDWSVEEIQDIFDLPFTDLMFRAQTAHRLYFDPNRVQVSTLLSIKTGACPEDCGYCAQSARHETGLERESLMPIDEVLDAARIARESDPKYIAKKKSEALRDKYGIGYIDQTLFPRMMAILKGVDSGNRLAEDDVVWLKTEAEEYFTDELQEAYHLHEAEFYAGEYRRTQDPWNVVNASGHYRKCSRPKAALELLDSVSGSRLKDPKIKSAMNTTRGGVMRDMGQLDEARQLGEKGHELKPQDFRPCTLLGAVHMEMGNFGEAHDWYAKAEKRGASTRAIDADLRSIFQRADQVKCEAIKAFLLAKDPNRYSWVNNNRYRNS